MAKRNKGSKILRFAVSGALASVPLVVGCGADETAPNMPFEETVEETINELPEEVETTNEVLEPPPDDLGSTEDPPEAVDDGPEVEPPSPRTNMPRQ